MLCTCARQTHAGDQHPTSYKSLLPPSLYGYLFNEVTCKTARSKRVVNECSTVHGANQQGFPQKSAQRIVLAVQQRPMWSALRGAAAAAGRLASVLAELRTWPEPTAGRHYSMHEGARDHLVSA